MPSTKILIVDNDQKAIQELKSKLSRLGYEAVESARTKEEAMERSARLKPGLMIINTRLRGGNDGIQTGKLILTRLDVPIIYIASSAGQMTIRRAGSTGPFGYIIQPFDDAQLLATIETALIRHRLEFRLRESQQWLSGVLKSIGDGVLAVDNLGSVRFINPTGEKLTGFNEAEAIGEPLFVVLGLKDEASGEFLDLSQKFQPDWKIEKDSLGIEAILERRDGQKIPVELNFNPIQSQGGQPNGMVIAFRDITSRRQAIEEIKIQAERADALAKVAKELNARPDLKEVLETVCKITNRVLKASASIVFLYDKKSDCFVDIARKFEPDLPESHSDQNRVVLSPTQLKEYLPEGNSVFSIPQSQFRDNFPFNSFLAHLRIQTLAVAPLVRNDEVIGALICGLTGTQDSRAENHEFLKGLAELVVIGISNNQLFEQVRQGRERQRLLSKNVVGIQEAERRRIARELHDHLGQELTGIQFMLEAMKNYVTESRKPDVVKIQDSVTETIRQVREMSLNLRPSMLDDLGLIQTVKWHVERYTNQTGIFVNFNAPSDLGRFPAEIEITAYRIIQEALTNVARHAKTAEVFVGIVVTDNTLWLEILDNGRGFDPSAVLRKASSGLSVMSERTDLAGGYLTVNSYIDQGTQIIAALPLSGKPLERRKSDRIYPARG